MDKELLSILVCPVSKAALSYNKDTEELICESSGLASVSYTHLTLPTKA